MPINQIILWGGFTIFVVAMLILDLAVFHKKAHEVKIKEALMWSAIWIALALVFNIGVYIHRGPDTALRFLTGYLLEKSLSIDNLFVFLLIFQYFHVSHKYQHKILFWGIIGALIFRALFIAAGITLIHKFHWVIYIFGAILIWTGFKLTLEKEKEVQPENNVVLKIFKKLMPVSTTYEGEKFFIKKDGRNFATPVFIVLLVIETTDIVFAVDSIPAILAISTDPFIVYTSNVFAILGLRALYFALAGVMQMFKHLHYGLAAILIFVGIKMLISEFYKIPIWISLSAIAFILCVSIIASTWKMPKISHKSH